MSEKQVDEDWKRRVQEERTQPVVPPSKFLGFISMLATQALVFLGAIPHPETGQTSTDLDQAQAIIDLLEVIEEKTKGNLTKDEEESLRQILSEARLAFVHKTNQPNEKEKA
jgi:hypothetical protein